MKVTISDEAAKRITKGGNNAVSVKIISVKGGWCGSIKVQDIELKKPGNEEDYVKFSVDGIDAYVHKGITGGTIAFEIKKALFFKSLYADGIDHRCYQ